MVMNIYKCGLLALLVGLVSGCASLVGSVTRGFAEDLSTAILDNQDIAMVRDGAPAYLILIDSMVARSPDDAFMLQQSATLHSAYAAAFVADENRARLLHTKARAQALEAACLSLQDGCDLNRRPYKEFAQWVQARQVKDVPIMYTLATAWTGWIQSHSDDFSAIADLARVKALMVRTSELQPEYQEGGVFLYLGIFETLFPPSMGGNPDAGKRYFEQAIGFSGGKNLLAKVAYAEEYARLVFDRALHDRLLEEVLAADVRQPGLTLMNTVAKEQAQLLLESADDYF